MDIPCLFFGAIFLICGVIFGIGKFHIFIPSWKKMSQEEKESISIEALVHNIGIVISLCGLIFIINGIFINFRMHFFVPSMILWLVIAGIDVVYISKSKRYEL